MQRRHWARGYSFGQIFIRLPLARIDQCPRGLALYPPKGESGAVRPHTPSRNTEGVHPQSTFMLFLDLIVDFDVRGMS